jgi:hypothetical protein
MTAPYENTTTFFHIYFDRKKLHYPWPLLFKKQMLQFFINLLVITLRARRAAVPMLPTTTTNKIDDDGLWKSPARYF